MESKHHTIYFENPGFDHSVSALIKAMTQLTYLFMLTLFYFKISIYLIKLFFIKLVCVHLMKD